MEPELEQKLYRARKHHLISLVQELITRHPALLPEMADILESFADMRSPGDTEEEIEEDWNFNGDSSSILQMGQLQGAPLHPVDSEEYRQHLADYRAILRSEESPEVLAEELANVLEEAELRAEHSDYSGALHLYALLIDERLSERVPALSATFDEAIRVATPTMEVLLSEASSSEILDAPAAAVSPLLTTSVRHSWLERLFALWLKRLDGHSIEEELPRIILHLAWSEDLLLLRSLVQAELQKQSPSSHSNIVDLAHQFRTRALEKFLKDLPRA